MMINVTVGNNVKRSAVIVPGNTTLRDVLEANGIDYTRGMTTLDGASLQPGDLDKSFEAFGITSRCSLLNVVKADNAAKAVVAGNAVVITSDVAFNTYEKIAKYEPDALVLYEGEGKEKHPVFAVGTGSGAGSISAYGVVFAKAPADPKKAQVTMVIGEIPAGETLKEYISDKIGRALLKLNKLEGMIPAAEARIDAEKAAIADVIQVAG